MEIVLTSVHGNRIMSAILSSDAPYQCSIIRKAGARTYFKVDTNENFGIVKNKLTRHIYEKDINNRIIVFAMHPVIDGIGQYGNFE